MNGSNMEPNVVQPPARATPLSRRALNLRLSWLCAPVLAAMVLLGASRWADSIWAGVFFLVACVLVGIATLGRVWCSLYIAGRKTTDLVTVGPYSMSRNPLYFFSLMGSVGVGFATETLLMPGLILLLFFLAYPRLIRSEEETLRAQHGEKFEAYRRTTPLLIPRVSLLREPDEYAVKPKIFRRSLFDALWFVWLLGIVELVESLHDKGILPSPLRLL